jgi:C4-dicarboxylate-specific signal transduction histidine kinase
VSVYSYLVLGVILVALAILARVVVPLLGRLGGLAAQARILQGRTAEIQQTENRIVLLNERMAEIQERLATTRPDAH